MPIYEYTCKNHERFELHQSIGQLKETIRCKDCDCKEGAERVLSPANVRVK